MQYLKIDLTKSCHCCLVITNKNRTKFEVGNPSRTQMKQQKMIGSWSIFSSCNLLQNLKFGKTTPNHQPPVVF